jgi:hypothetical protein
MERREKKCIRCLFYRDESAPRPEPIKTHKPYAKQHPTFTNKTAYKSNNKKVTNNLNKTNNQPTNQQ